MVNQVQEVLKNEYLDPFDHTLDKTKLYNLSSVLPLDVETTEEILHIPNTGVRLAAEFRQEHLLSKTLSFHAPITRSKYHTFSKALKSVTIKKNNKVKIQEVNQNIISNLLSFTVKSGKVIDFEEALKYLSPIPLSIANAEGTRQTTLKSKLKGIIYASRTIEMQMMMAQIRSMSGIPKTFEGLAQNFVKSILSGYMSGYCSRYVQ